MYVHWTIISHFTPCFFCKGILKKTSIKIKYILLNKGKSNTLLKLKPVNRHRSGDQLTISEGLQDQRHCESAGVLWEVESSESMFLGCDA